MQNQLITILTIVLLASCTPSYDSLETASEKVSQSSSIKSAAVNLDSKNKSTCCTSASGACEEEEALPPTKYSWDIKMVLW